MTRSPAARLELSLVLAAARRRLSRWPMGRLLRCTLAVLVYAAAGCGAGPAERPNLVLITVDTLRADRLGPYGYEGIETPAVERLADAGVLYERAFCESTWTIPSMASVMTGRYPDEHGVRTVYGKLAERETTLAEVLRGSGYHTSAIVASYPLDHRYGFDQGFDSYDDDTDTALVGGGARPAGGGEASFAEERGRWVEARQRTRAYRPDDEVARRAVEWLESNPPEPYFLWVHFFGPHEKPHRYARHLIPREKRKEHYDRDVAFMDRQLARVLRALDGAPGAHRTAVAFHSDHGETLDEHKPGGHGLDVYDTTAHVPLILRLPGGERAGERVPWMARNLDLFPTLLNLAGAPVPPGTRGRDLLRDPGPRSPIHVSTAFPAAGPGTSRVEIDGEEMRIGPLWRGVRTERWKLIELAPVLAFDWEERDDYTLPRHYVRDNATVHLYDLEADPQEQTDVAAERPERVASLRARLRDHRRRAEQSGPQSTRSLDAEERERLRQLGYLD